MKDKNSARALKLGSILFSCIGLVFLLIGILSFLNTHKKLSYYLPATATITRINTRTDSDGERHHSVYMEYEADGVLYTDIRFPQYDSSMYEGKTIRIAYDPVDPTRLILAGNSAFNIGIILMLFGGIFSGVGIYSLICFLQKRREEAGDSGERYLR